MSCFCNANTNGNNFVSNYVRNNYCSIQNDAILKLTTLQDSTWTDSVSGNDVSLVKSNAVILNGTDNGIDTGSYVTGGQPIDLNLHIKITSSADNKYIFYCGGDNATNSGFRIRLNTTTNVAQVYFSDGTTYTGGITFSFTDVPSNQWFNLSVVWSGLSGENMTIGIDSDYKTNAMPGQWAGNSYANLFLYN